MDPLAGVIAQMGAPVGDTAAVDVNWTLFTNTFQSIDTPLVDAVTATIGALTGYLAPIMVPMLTVYLIIFGIQSAMGRVPLSAFLSVALRAAVVVYIIANAANFNQWVGNVFLQAIPNDIGNAVNGALGGGAPINGGQQFDTVWNDAYTAGLVVWKALPSLSLKGIMMCGVVVLFWATALASVALGFLMFLASQVLMALLIAIGPIFIACALFGASRQFFNGWLSACVSTVVAQLLIVTLNVADDPRRDHRTRTHCCSTGRRQCRRPSRRAYGCIGASIYLRITCQANTQRCRRHRWRRLPQP